MDVPWDRVALARFMPAMGLADPAIDESQGLKLGVTANPAQADRFLAGSGHTILEIVDAANSNRPLPRFAPPRTAQGNGRHRTVGCRLPKRGSCAPRIRPDA